MLTPDQLKPHLLHEDRWVRGAVMEYFGDCRSRDPEVAGLVLAAHERYYRKGEFPQLNCLKDVLLDDAAAERVLALLAAAPSHITAIHLNWCVAAFPLAFLRKEGERIEHSPGVSEEARARIRLRRELAELSDEELWQRFLDFSGRARMRRSPVRADIGRDEAITEELATRRSPDEDAICEMLRSPTYDGTWFESLVVRLAGAKGSKRAVPHLVRRVRGDDDLRPSYELRALMRIGDPAVVRLIRERWPRFSYRARMEASEVLRGIKVPESEEALLAFFREEEDRDVRFFIAGGLCNLFSREGIGPVLEAIRDGSAYNEPLENKLLPVLDILGIELPEAEAWRMARAEDLARHPLRDEPSPEAELLHRKIMESLIQIDTAEEEIQKIYEQLGQSLADGDEE